MRNLPRVIWMYWHQGFEQAPILVKECVKSWEKNHKNWDINLLDANSIDSFIDPIPISVTKLDRLSLAHRSDLIRTQLLIKYGGVWVDPTCYCLKPLDDWLLKNTQASIFLFFKPGRDRIISNWFIASQKNNLILQKLYSELINYWESNEFRNMQDNKLWYEATVSKILNRQMWTTKFWFSLIVTKILNIYPYMVYHYKFYQIISKNSEAKKIWAKTPKFSADGPHRLQRIGLLNNLNNEAKEIIDSKKFPLFKLTWKIDSMWAEHSVLGYLFK